MRIGIFGGSFDPVHFGHLWIAETALESLNLDQIRWIPAARSPLKSAGPAASDEDRVQMLRLAIAGAKQHVVDDREINRGDVSYTIDTVTELREEMPDAELFLIIGSDSLASFRHWREPEKLLQQIIPAVVQRGGNDAIDFSAIEDLVNPQRLREIRRNVIPMPLIEVSSTDLRERASQGRSIRFRTPRAVEAMIIDRGLYRS